MPKLTIRLLASGAVVLWAAVGAPSAFAKHTLRVETKSHAAVTPSTPAWGDIKLRTEQEFLGSADCYVVTPGSFLSNDAAKVEFKGSEGEGFTECDGGSSLERSTGVMQLSYSKMGAKLTGIKLVLELEGCVYELPRTFKFTPAGASTVSPKLKTHAKLNKTLSEPHEEATCVPRLNEVWLEETGVSEEAEFAPFEEPFLIAYT